MLWPSRRNYQAWCFRAVPLEGKGEVVREAKVLGHSSQCFFVVWQHSEGHPQPPHEGCCTKTNWAAGRASKRLKLKQKGEDWEKEESMRNRTHFSAMVSAVLTSSWFWGAFTWKMERAKRWKKDFPTRTSVLEKKKHQELWAGRKWSGEDCGQQSKDCPVAWLGLGASFTAHQEGSGALGDVMCTEGLGSHR